MKSSFPFILKKRADRNGVYYVSFKSPLDGRITSTKSTETTDRNRAIQLAFEWYKSGIPEKGGDGKKTIDSLAVISAVRKDKLSDVTVDELLKEIERRTGDKIKRISKNSKGAVNAYQFMLDFWDWEKSPYIKEKLRKNHRIGKPHVLRQQSSVRRFWKPILENKMLCEITKQDIWDFLDRQESDGASFQTKNDRVRAVTTALGWAFEREYIDRDISRGFVFFSGAYKERAILTPEMAEALFSFRWDDARAMLANAVAMCTGMRSAEIASLQLQDIGRDCLYVRHSWNAKDGLKCTKNGENRRVLLPFPQITGALKRLAESNPYGGGMERFVFWATIPDKPLEPDMFLKGLRKSLERIGVEDPMKYTFHAWRHYFATYMKDRVRNSALQKQTGHKDLAVLEHYASHGTSADDESMENAQRELFGKAVAGIPEISVDEKKLYANVKNSFIDKSGMYGHSRQDR